MKAIILSSNKYKSRFVITDVDQLAIDISQVKLSEYPDVFDKEAFDWQFFKSFFSISDG